MIYNNRRFFTRQSFEIKSTGINIHKKTLFDSLEHEVSFEKIDNKKKIQTTVNNGLLIISFFFFVTGLWFLLAGNNDVCFVFWLIALFLILVAFITKLKVVTIACYDGTNIDLYFKRGNKEDVVEFANQIINSGNSYLLNKYSKIDKDLPIDSQIYNLEFLRNKEIITEEQFENLKNQLLGRENKSSIGFSQ